MSSALEDAVSEPSAWQGVRGWKGLVAVVALSLSALIWIGGLMESLNRPSVVTSLDLRQMELTVLAAEVLPPPLRPLLVGDDPRSQLIQALEERTQDQASPPLASQRLELALLRRDQTAASVPLADATLKELSSQVDAPRRPLIQALEQRQAVSPERRQTLLAPWGESSLVAQLGCEQLGGPASSCPASRLGFWLALRLVGLTLLPALLMLAGVGLLVRQLWLLRSGRLPPAPALVGPPLSLLDVSLVIAGGFVLLGEVVVPVLIQGGLPSLLRGWNLPETTRQGLEVLGSYLALMLAPLGLLALLLPKQLTPPPEGWLQWRWRPWRSVAVPAVKVLLMVLPLVALASWLLQQVWADPGGSNPLLEMVLNNSDSWALLALAFTAVVLAPLFEETLFRGVLLPVVGRHVGALGAVLISALVFAIAHLSLGELVPLSVLGLGLGWLRWQSGRLAASVCLHALWNSLTFLNLLLLAR